MKAVFYILAIVGIALIGLALYVFLFAARNFVSESHKPSAKAATDAAPSVTQFRPRSTRDRRTGRERRHFAGEVLFPLVDSSGNMVEFDRRMYDRRSGADRRA